MIIQHTSNHATQAKEQVHKAKEYHHQLLLSFVLLDPSYHIHTHHVYNVCFCSTPFYVSALCESLQRTESDIFMSPLCEMNKKLNKSNAYINTLDVSHQQQSHILYSNTVIFMLPYFSVYCSQMEKMSNEFTLSRYKMKWNEVNVSINFIFTLKHHRMTLISICNKVRKISWGWDKIPTQYNGNKNLMKKNKSSKRNLKLKPSLSGIHFVVSYVYLSFKSRFFSMFVALKVTIFQRDFITLKPLVIMYCDSLHGF